jgi:hypothetical protein
VLLLLNGSRIGKQYKNSWPTTAALLGALVLFLAVGAIELHDNYFSPPP